MSEQTWNRDSYSKELDNIKERICHNCAWFLEDSESCRVYEPRNETPVDPEFSCHKHETKKKSNSIKTKRPSKPIAGEDDYEVHFTRDNKTKGKY